MGGGRLLHKLATTRKEGQEEVEISRGVVIGESVLTAIERSPVIGVRFSVSATFPTR